MKIGDLVIWKGTWGLIDHLYDGRGGNQACSVVCGKDRMAVTAWTDAIQAAMEVEVKTGIKLSPMEVQAILSVSDKDQITLLGIYANKYLSYQPRIIGFGLLETGEIIYTQVIPK